MNIVAKLIFITMFFVLSGCAINPTEFQKPEKLNSTHGYVFSPKVQSSLLELGEVKIRSKNDGEIYTLQQNDSKFEGYGLWVPSGKYELVDMFDRALENNSHAPIEVSAGSFTEIGGLIWINVGHDKRVLLPIHHSELEPQVKKAKLIQDPYLLDHTIKVWKPNSVADPVYIPHESANHGIIIDLMLDYGRKIGLSNLNQQLINIKDPDEFFAAAKRTLPPITHSAVSGSDGAQYFGAELGQIRVRNTNGLWSSFDTGTLDNITAISIDHQIVVAATSKGAILKKNDNNWNVVAKIPGSPEVINVVHTSAGWLILAGDFSSSSYSAFPIVKALSIFRANDNFSNLVQIKKISMDGEREIFRPAAFYVNDKYYVNGFNKLHVLDVKTGIWNLVDPGHEITSLTHDKNSSIFTAYKMQGIFSKLSISTDYGVSWSPMNTPGMTVQDIIFTSPSHAITVGLDMGLLSASFEVSKYEPLEKKSELISKSSPGICKKIVTNEEMNLFFCISDDGSILQFGDKRMVPEFILN
ncbi:hypothetical protein LQR30_20255 [Chromobacterium piscinae]|uniref:hypothetical protein n=1 Tax=Chromobacterium piscinae TaxID=686831 RepID=UPI001E489678|nr:hypothetical protein [Chromobacterium piscinae]MCD4506406.1 hypothetical protein [Chromobacterium piscinae]